MNYLKLNHFCVKWKLDVPSNKQIYNVPDKVKSKYSNTNNQGKPTSYNSPTNSSVNLTKFYDFRAKELCQFNNYCKQKNLVYHATVKTEEIEDRHFFYIVSMEFYRLINLD